MADQPITAATDTADAIHLLNTRISRDRYLRLARLGDMAFTPAPVIESIDFLDEGAQALSHDQVADRIREGDPVYVGFTIHPEGAAGTTSHGMVLLTVDLEDQVSVELHAN